jgi:hypothetical protein
LIHAACTLAFATIRGNGKGALRMSQLPDALVWVDLEMTGLRPDVDHIIEMAVIITDNQ